MEKLARDPKNAHALDALFAVHMLGGLDDNLAMDLLKHPDPYVRRWVVRCTGDRNEASTLLASGLKTLAATEQHPEVRTQLLCSAKRLPADAGLPIVRTMMERDEDMQDQRIPLLLWWAIESKAVSDRDAVLALFEDPKVWDSEAGARLRRAESREALGHGRRKGELRFLREAARAGEARPGPGAGHRGHRRPHLKAARFRSFRRLCQSR